MVLPAFVVPVLLAGGGGSLVTGVITYFFARGSGTTEHEVNKTDSRGEIYNNVHLAVKENNNQNNALVVLLTMLVVIKVIEVIIYTISTIKKNLKKKYESKYELQLRARPVQPQPNE